LSGEVPAFLDQWTNLTSLYLQNNQFTGPLPASLTNLTKLNHLWLYSNALTGGLPAGVGSLPALASVYVQDNQFTALPAFGANPNKANLSVKAGQNQLDFADLEPSFTGAGVSGLKEFTYGGQALVDLAFHESTRTLSVSVGGTNNAYQWRKDGVDISGATAGSLVLSAEQYAQGGHYQCQVTNTLVTGMIILSQVRYVKNPTPAGPAIALNPAASLVDMNYIVTNVPLVGARRARLTWRACPFTS